MTADNVRVASLHAVAPSGSDGVADHASLLSDALEQMGSAAAVFKADWRARGWGAVSKAIEEVRQFEPSLVVVHYSHLGWSKRGLPLGVLRVVGAARRIAPVVLWVHDPGRVERGTVRQRIAGAAKGVGLAIAARLSRTCVVTVDPSRIYWMTTGIKERSRFCPSPSSVGSFPVRAPTDIFTVNTFGIRLTSDAQTVAILSEFCLGLAARIGPFRLRILGDNAALPEDMTRTLEEARVSVEIPGRLPAELLGELLASAHVYVHLRGVLSTRSSTLAAALSCGLAVVGAAGEETGPPLNDDVVAIVDALESANLVEMVVALKADRARLRALSAGAAETARRYYGWDVAATIVLDSGPK